MCGVHDGIPRMFAPLLPLAQRYEQGSEFVPAHEDISTTE